MTYAQCNYHLNPFIIIAWTIICIIIAAFPHFESRSCTCALLLFGPPTTVVWFFTLLHPLSMEALLWKTLVATAHWTLLSSWLMIIPARSNIHHQIISFLCEFDHLSFASTNLLFCLQTRSDHLSGLGCISINTVNSYFIRTNDIKLHLPCCAC